MKTTIVIIGTAALAFAARDASAGPKKLKGEFLCGTYADGKIVKPITGGKVGKITDTIACAFHLADPAEPAHAVHVRTVRNGTELTNVTGTVNDEGDNKDFEIYLKPNEAFKPCQDFDITVGVSDPGGQFSKTIKVLQGCPKPPPLKAELTCSSEYGDGTPIQFPKTKKLGGRIEKPIDCMIYAKKVPDGVKLTGSIMVKGKSAHTDLMADTPPTGQKMDASLEPDTDFESCSTKFSIIGSLVDGDGNQRWTGTIVVPAQFCPD